MNRVDNDSACVRQRVYVYGGEGIQIYIQSSSKMKTAIPEGHATIIIVISSVRPSFFIHSKYDSLTISLQATTMSWLFFVIKSATV